MYISDTVRLNHRIYSALRCGTTYLFFLLIPCIIWSLKSAVSYGRIENVINNHKNTTCLVLNYTLLKHESMNCGTRATYKTNTCFDEHILVQYRLENQSDIISTVKMMNTHTLHDRSQIGQRNVCFYHRTSVTTVVLELPNGLSSLIQLFLAIGLLVSLFVIISIALLFILVRYRIGAHLTPSTNSDDLIDFHYSNVQQTDY
ncbi:hypothetical protein I4U23_025098 [Adineta vaga]|nr:hypothetical protein I4U23_025098 [Adineta vaga]